MNFFEKEIGTNKVLQIKQGDIIHQKVEVLVTATNEHLRGLLNNWMV